MEKDFFDAVFFTLYGVCCMIIIFVVVSELLWQQRAKRQNQKLKICENAKHARRVGSCFCAFGVAALALLFFSCYSLGVSSYAYLIYACPCLILIVAGVTWGRGV